VSFQPPTFGANLRYDSIPFLAENARAPPQQDSRLTIGKVSIQKPREKCSEQAALHYTLFHNVHHELATFPQRFLKTGEAHSPSKAAVRRYVVNCHPLRFYENWPVNGTCAPLDRYRMPE
jgi:hypothetical protein